MFHESELYYEKELWKTTLTIGPDDEKKSSESKLETEYKYIAAALNSSPTAAREAQKIRSSDLKSNLGQV